MYCVVRMGCLHNYRSPLSGAMVWTKSALDFTGTPRVSACVAGNPLEIWMCDSEGVPV